MMAYGHIKVKFTTGLECAFGPPAPDNFVRTNGAAGSGQKLAIGKTIGLRTNQDVPRRWFEGQQRVNLRGAGSRRQISKVRIRSFGVVDFDPVGQAGLWTKGGAESGCRENVLSKNRAATGSQCSQ